jgi:hypothetical protein
LAIVGAVVLALLGPLSGTVVAQDADPAADSDVHAPAVVTGTIRPVRPNQPPEAQPASLPLVASIRNYGWTMELETDDPRLGGEFETNSNYDTYSTGAKASTFIGRLTNDGGSWAIVGQGLSLGGLNHYVNYYTGRDGYEGLSAMLLQRPAPGGWEVEGVIIPGAWPEPPEWVLPPVE